MTMSYDRAADVLYVTFEKSASGSYIYVENENGDVLRMDRDTKRVVGCTIPCFLRRASISKVTVPEVGDVPFNALAEELLTVS
jgi:uncharacterized protein YuzE